jgi:hypothetical protein
MRNKLLLFLVLPLFLTLQALGQGTVKDFLGTPKTFDSVGDSVIATGNGHGTVGFQISGTWTGTISFTGTINGTDWVTVKGWDSESATAITEATANGIYFFSTTGLRYVKAKSTTYTTGPATIQTITTDDVTVMSSISAAGGGEGAEGTVDLTGINGVTPSTGNGTTGTGSLRVTIASNNTAFTVNAAQATASSLNAEVQGDAAHDATASGNPVQQGGVASAAAPTSVSADGDAVAAWYLRNGAQATVVTAAGALVGGDATNGLDVDVTRLNDGGNSITVDNGGTFAVQAGQAAHDAAIAGNPVRTGLRAATAHPAAVATGVQVDQLGTIEGKVVTQPYAVRGETWSYAAASGGITDATAVTVKTAAGSGVRNCVTSIQVINGHASVSTETLILDGAAGTVIWRGFAQAAGGGVAAELPVPICGSANTLLEVDNGTTGAAVYYNLQGFESQE